MAYLIEYITSSSLCIMLI